MFLTDKNLIITSINVAALKAMGRGLDASFDGMNQCNFSFSSGCCYDS